MNPKISVCLPVYNGAPYLPECLDSILAQTFSDFEVLIVDDNSTDNSLEIVKNYAQQDQRIRWVKNATNLGLGGNWNRCFELAAGEWIKFVFQDDTIYPDCLLKMIEASDPAIGIVYCKRQFVFDSQVSKITQKHYLNHLNEVNQIFAGQQFINPSRYREAVLNYINQPGFNLIGEPTTVMLHKSISLRFGTFNTKMIQTIDEEYWTRIASNQGIIYLEEDLAIFRIHGQSTTMQNRQQKLYRLGMIDPLIRLYEMAFNPVYEPLRQFAAHDYYKPVDLRELYQRQAYKTALKARIYPNRDLMAQWQQIVQDYPSFAKHENEHYWLVKEIPAYFSGKVAKFLAAKRLREKLIASYRGD